MTVTKLRLSAGKRFICPKCGNEMRFVSGGAVRVVNGKVDMDATLPKQVCDHCKVFYRELLHSGYFDEYPLEEETAKPTSAKPIAKPNVKPNPAKPIAKPNVRPIAKPTASAAEEAGDCNRRHSADTTKTRSRRQMPLPALRRSHGFCRGRSSSDHQRQTRFQQYHGSFRLSVLQIGLQKNRRHGLLSMVCKINSTEEC